MTILKRGEHFSRWDFDQAAKKDGGEAFIEVRHTGEIDIHKGFAPRRKQAAKRKGEGGETETPRPECSAPLENYVDLHRLAAARESGARLEAAGRRARIDIPAYLEAS